MTTKSQSTTTKLEASEPTLEPCGVCKFHWNMIVMPGEKHHRYCPHYDDDGKGCACHGCAQRYRVDIQIPDDLWERIKPEGRESGAGLLCGSCISSRIEALGEFDAYTLTRVSANTVPTVDQAAIKCNDSNMEAWRKIFDRVTSTVPYSDEQPLRGVVKDANTVIKLLYKEVLSLRAAASPVAPQQSEPQYLTINGQRRMVIPCPDGKPDCEVLHTAPAPSAAIQDEITTYFDHARTCISCGPEGFCSEGLRLYNGVTTPRSTQARAAAEEWFVRRGEKYPEAQPAIDELTAIIERCLSEGKA